jgi:hypothetical protein
VNRQQFLTFVWLRWRVRVNQLRRSGLANRIILGVLAAGAVLLALVLLAISFPIGLFAFSEAPPVALLYTWDGIVAVFLFMWLTGLLTDLQRPESLSLDKFLHLPVSLAGAFFINYLSSLFSVVLLLFVPAMLGLTIGLIVAKGPVMLLLLPLLASFLFAATALTYQFQGWLAALMMNQRRRRTVIVIVTAAFILVAQLPNLINIIRPWDRRPRDEAAERQAKDEEAELVRLRAEYDKKMEEYRKQYGDVEVNQKVTPQALKDRQKASQKLHALYERQQELSERQISRQWRLSAESEHTFRIVNMALPPGWLPLGAMALAERDVLPAILAALGLAVIGTASLWRAYTTTLRLYRGEFSAGKAAPARAVAPVPRASSSSQLLERRLPWLSEHASAIALSGIRSLVRAPEAKMVLLTPIILVIVFGSMLLTRRAALPEGLRPLLAFGGIGMTLLCMVQLVGNQFGFDRSGFRVFVLCPARRREILLGKNLAAAPLALGLSAVALIGLQVVYPMPWDYFVAWLPQAVSMYLLFCILANWLSILAPMPISAGSLKPVNPKVIPVLLHFAFVLLMPFVLAPVLAPWLIELALGAFGWLHGVPVCLILALMECVAVVFLYRVLLATQGNLLQAREKKILEIVTSKME